ncbi:tRNA pseudouridine(13) synthase TruD [Methylomonas methanica]|uniref:tRNA pseudouridine(13) synthase TruD n=1 Tax=Methylomonas methanica TaxID=421 RepID=UPI0003112B1A
MLSADRFSLRIRNWQGNRDVSQLKLQQIKTLGFPNFFGEQRFGHQGRNIENALDMFQSIRIKSEMRNPFISHPCLSVLSDTGRATYSANLGPCLLLQYLQTPTKLQPVRHRIAGLGIN